MEPTKLSMITMSCFDQFLIEGPGNLGVFLTPTGLPGRPPIQLSSNLKSVNQVGESYLAVADGEFVTIYGDDNGQLEQLQIVPIPGIKLIVHSITMDVQLCCTSDAIYRKKSKTFYPTFFFLKKCLTLFKV